MIAGAGCAIERGALVAGSVLWDGVTVGEGATVRGSVLAEGARVGAGAVVARAVIAHGAVVEAAERPPAGIQLDPEAAYRFRRYRRAANAEGERLMAEIRFGTDGWRAVIADDYTFANVRAVAQATADWMQRAKLAERGAVVGYDTRFLSDAFANAAAEVLAGNEIRVALASAPAPTPALSHAVIERGAGAGVVITASHNPARWNGFKIKQAVGNSASARGHE